MKTIFDELQQEVKNWWISLILGILYVIVALWLMVLRHGLTGVVLIFRN